MEGIVEKGLAKAIGLSNFTITKTANLLKTAKTVPAVNQVECHPFFQQQKLKEYCNCKGIAGKLKVKITMSIMLYIKPLYYICTYAIYKTTLLYMYICYI